MPGWLRGYLNFLGGPVVWLFRWGIGVTESWIKWVNQSINDIGAFSMRSYILLTYDVANFSYYVGSFSAATRKWIEWLAYSRIPDFLGRAERYAYRLDIALQAYEDNKRRELKRQLIALISFVDTVLTAAINKEILDRKIADISLRDYLLKIITAVYNKLHADIMRERAARIKADNALRKWVQQQLNNLWTYAKSILPTVDKEAADGYNSTRANQASGISSLIDDLVKDNPVVKDIAGKLATMIIDVASVEDPALRIAAQFVLTQLVDRLGAGKLVGGLINDLAGQLLGTGKPTTLENVEKSVGQRLNATEAQWQQFFINGGDDVEHLGQQMRGGGQPVFLAAMAAWLVGAVADPEGTAAATDAVVTPAARLVLAPLLALLGG